MKLIYLFKFLLNKKSPFKKIKKQILKKKTKTKKIKKTNFFIKVKELFFI